MDTKLKIAKVTDEIQTFISTTDSDFAQYHYIYNSIADLIKELQTETK